MTRQYKILIADDEFLAREAIKLCLPKNDLFIVTECPDGVSTLAAIIQEMPDIIFLDIQMPGLTGFEVLGSLPEKYDPYLIVVSAHDQFALKAYEYSVSDYLVKPFSEERFGLAFERARQQCHERIAHAGQNAVRLLAERIEALLAPKAYKTRISIKDGAKITVVPCEEIVYIAANGDYTTVYTTNKKMLHTETLAALEDALDPARFIRIHRSCIVNTVYIRELTSHYNGDYSVILHNGDSLRLSRNYREQLLRQLG